VEYGVEFKYKACQGDDWTEGESHKPKSMGFGIQSNDDKTQDNDADADQHQFVIFWRKGEGIFVHFSKVRPTTC
jgi:hypothetical protein